MDPSVLEKMRAVAEDVARQLGLSLFDIEHRLGGRRWWFRVTIEREGGTVSLADCESVSRLMSARLDLENFIPHTYQLEVSSPGIERPLRSPGDFERFRGSKAKIILGPGGPDAGLAVEGSLAGCDGKTVAIERANGEVFRAEIGRIKSAHLLFTPEKEK